MKEAKIFNKTGGRKHCSNCSSVKLKPLLIPKPDGKFEYGFVCQNCGYENIKKYKDFIVKY